MTDAIPDFSRPLQAEATTGRKLLQVWMDVHLVATIDAWRSMQPDNPPRMEAIRRLVAFGLASHALDAAKAAKRKRR